jgi:hypothetical protein
MIKIGRRGSLNGRLTVRGAQGHVAYPHLADNPLPRLIKMLAALDALVLDQGTAHFDPSNLEVVSIDVGNGATNVIPATGEAAFNIRFNDSYTGESLEALLRQTLDGVGGDYELKIELTGESFLTPPGPLAKVVKDAVEAATGRRALHPSPLPGHRIRPGRRDDAQGERERGGRRYPGVDPDLSGRAGAVFRLLGHPEFLRQIDRDENQPVQQGMGGDIGPKVAPPEIEQGQP